MFRFTIRELVLLTLVVAMGVAWWLDRTALAKVNAEQSHELDIRAWMLTGLYPQWEDARSVFLRQMAPASP
jgi:hypothetical protein